MQSRLPRRRRHRADAAFEGRDSFFKNGDCGIRYPRIDVPGPFQIEQGRRVIGILEHIGRRLINRRRPRTGNRVRLLARMKAERIEFKKLGVDHGLPFGRVGNTRAA